MTDLTPREQAAQRLLGLKALEKLLEVEIAAARAEALKVYTRAGQKDPIDLPDGARLGDVRVDKVKGGWKVTDPGALRAWVAKNRPDLIIEQVTTVVDPAWVTELLREAGEILDTETGEVFPVPGVSLVPDGIKLVATPDKGAPTAVRTMLGPVAAQLGLREVEA